MNDSTGDAGGRIADSQSSTTHLDVTGYAHPAYALSLRDFGVARLLPRCRGYVLERGVPHSTFRDGMGCYPLFACAEWAGLPADIEELKQDLVTLTLVVDSSEPHAINLLRRGCDDVRPFKQHAIVDLLGPWHSHIAPHHQRNVKKGLSTVEVEECLFPPEHAQTWVNLYAELIARHGITGIRAFTPSALSEQLHVPGVVMFRAVHASRTVGMTIWFTCKDVVYYHLGACTAVGYRLNATFAMFQTALEKFAASGMSTVNLGSGAGHTDTLNGLVRFKRGWSGHTRSSYLCTRVFDHESYEAIVRSTRTAAATYFPAYRHGEFH